MHDLPFGLSAWGRGCGGGPIAGSGSLRQRRKPAGDRKQEIVGAAIRLAGEIGPDRVTTKALADAVGVTQPAIFRHFPVKTDIWLAVGETIARRMAVEDADTGSDPVARLAELVVTHFGQIARNPAIPAILFSRELHSENEALRRHFESVMANRRAGFSRLVARGIDSGQLLPGLNPDDVAALVLAAIQGLAMRWSLEDRRFDLQAEGARLIGTLIAALSARQLAPSDGNSV